MVSVIGINPSTNNLNQVDIAKKRTIINALNTIDINNNYELKKTTDAVNSIFFIIHNNFITIIHPYCNFSNFNKEKYI